jgi:chromosomal replication initiation ATPase DnaA
MTDLDPKLTFENFVVGPANRLASAAARRAADTPGSAYNPLFLYGPSGVGKSHILIAVAHQAAKRAGAARVLYRTMEEFLEELTQALAAGQRDGLRDRYRELDLLLLDDIQFLAGQAEAQEMLLRFVDALTTTGRQILLASDRAPAAIDALDERLLSRFAGGLIVDIAPPEFETRVAIVRRKAEERDQILEKGVAEALARRPFRNVRELSGSLNRVLAVQELEGRQVAPEDLTSLLGEPRREPSEVDDALGALLAEITGSIGVQEVEEPWRKALRDASAAAESEGFSAVRLRELLGDRHAPRDWEERLARFGRDLARLREIDRDLDRLGNPWPEAAAMLLRDPDRLEEAEALLASVRERVRPFPELAPGPDLDALAAHFPQLPIRAAQQLAHGEKPRYTPLFVWSGDPGSARALLAATGRAFRDRDGDARVAVTSVADFAQDFIRALSEGVAGAWRERWWTVDLLLVHGVEDLSDTERAQDEFFHLFEALKRRGSRVMLAGDRPPAKIQEVDDRLRSRFEGGLVLEAPARELPDGAAEVEFVTEGTEAAGRVWHGLTLTPDGTAPAAEARSAPPGAEVPSATLAEGPPAPSDEDGAAPWRPSNERVVWTWPLAEERLVEELD